MKKLLFVLLTLFIISCQDEELNLNKEQDYGVSRQEVQLIASNLDFNQSNLKSVSDEDKEIDNIFEISENGIVLIYIVNFKDEGFTIIAADKRAFPILAYSSTGQIDLNNLGIGLGEWLYEQKVYVQNIDYIDYKLITLNEMLWEELDAIIIDPVPNPDFPTVTVSIKGPLLSTQWGQGCGYNALCPLASDGPCGHAYTGCLSTAMAQIMRYHSFPLNYNWTSMPSNSGNAEIAILMRDIGDAVDMDYGGDGSSADTPEVARDAFVNDFGYSSSAQYIDYFGNQSSVEQQIKWGYPVLMRGGEKKYWAGIIPYYANGHAWVCDGYKRVDYEYQGVPTNSYLYLHMNWGWTGSADGWFAYNNFNPSGLDFNYKTGCVINIHP